jgi:uncharacterized protein (TIGR03000 family)
MYSVVLLAALTAGESTPNWLFHKHGCHGCYGGFGGYGCWGCHGCYGGWGCHGGYGGWGCHGGYGGWGCHGCYGGWGCHGCYGCDGGYGACYGGWDGYGHGPSYAGCWGAGYACYGCCGGYGTVDHGGVPLGIAPGMPAAPAGESIGKPKVEDKDKGKGKGTDEGEVSAKERARVIVELPSNAALYIDDRPIENTATRRTFKTPALEKGQAYFYEVRAEVMVDGKPVSETRRVIVRAGETVKADFRPLARGGKSGVTTVKAH